MVIIEMREAAYNKVFELLDEMKELGKKKKMVMCELEDAIYDCYEASKDEDKEEYEDPEERYDDQIDMKFRRNRAMRRSMRNMKSHNHEDFEDEDDLQMRGNSKSGMRRHNLTSRYV